MVVVEAVNIRLLGHCKNVGRFTAGSNHSQLQGKIEDVQTTVGHSWSIHDLSVRPESLCVSDIDVDPP